MEVGVSMLTKGQLLDDNFFFLRESQKSQTLWLLLIMVLCIIKQRFISPATGASSLGFMPVVLTSPFASCSSSPSTG